MPAHDTAMAKLDIRINSDRQALFEQTWGLDPATYVPLSEDQMQELLYDEAIERERERLCDAQ